MGLRITNEGDKPVMWCYGTIGDDYAGVTVDMMREALAEIPKNQAFQLRIFSDGGSFDQAMAMHSLISQRGNKSQGIVDGLAASAASLLLQATGRRSMAAHSRQMMHEVHGQVRNSLSANEFRDIATQMDATNATLVAIYMKNWKGTEAELRDALAAETWLNATDAVKCGMADEVVEGTQIAARINTDLFNYKNVPDDVILAHGPFMPPWFEQMEKQLEECLK